MAIKDWQDAHGGCPTASCAYIQLHGKAKTTCPQDMAFISSGLGTRFPEVILTGLLTSALFSVSTYRSPHFASSLASFSLPPTTPGHDPASLAWYLTQDLPARRLQAALTDAFPTWNVSLPTDSPCILTASKTVFGKYVNGVPLDELCGTDATPEGATGAFVHVEQAIEARGEEAYEGWVGALRKAFLGGIDPKEA